MTVVQGKIVDSTGSGAPGGSRVTIRLYMGEDPPTGPQPGFVGVTDQELVSDKTLFTNPDGTWSIDLIPNGNIIPAGSSYQVSEEGRAGPPKKFFIQVPAVGPVWVGDILIDPPTLSYTPSAFPAHLVSSDPHPGAYVKLSGGSVIIPATTSTPNLSLRALAGQAVDFFRIEGSAGEKWAFVDPNRVLNFRPPSASALALASRLQTGDTFDRFLVKADGRHEWGPGNTATDIFLFRSAANQLTVSNDLLIAGTTRTPQIRGASTDLLLTNSAGFVVRASPSVAADQALQVRGVASQVGHLTDWQNSAGTSLIRVEAGGSLIAPNTSSRHVLGGSAAATNRTLTIYSTATGAVPLTNRAVASQTGSLFDVQDSAGANLFSLDGIGRPKWDANVQTTVGAAGGASALPATPRKYLKAVDDTGTPVVIPCYAAS